MLCWDYFCFTLPSACIHSSCAWTRYFHSSKHTPTQTNHGWEVFWESTPQPVPKHTPTVSKAQPESVLWCLLGCSLVFVGMCFPECALVLPECALALPGVCFAKGWAPKKIPKIMQILFPKKRQKALVFIGTLLL